MLVFQPIQPPVVAPVFAQLWDTLGGPAFIAVVAVSLAYIYLRQRATERDLRVRNEMEDQKAQRTLQLAREQAAAEAGQQIQTLYERMLKAAEEDKSVYEQRLRDLETGNTRCAQRISDLEQQLRQRDAQLAERDEAIRARNQQITEHEKRIADMEANHRTLLEASAIESEFLATLRELVKANHLADTGQLKALEEQAVQRARQKLKGQK